MIVLILGEIWTPNTLPLTSLKEDNIVERFSGEIWPGKLTGVTPDPYRVKGVNQNHRINVLKPSSSKSSSHRKYKSSSEFHTFPEKRNEWLRILVNSCIKEMNKIGMTKKKKSCASMLQKEERYAISKIKRTVGMKIMVEDSRRCNIPAVRKRLDSCRINKTKTFNFALYTLIVWVGPTDTCEHTPYMDR